MSTEEDIENLKKAVVLLGRGFSVLSHLALFAEQKAGGATDFAQKALVDALVTLSPELNRVLSLLEGAVPRVEPMSPLITREELVDGYQKQAPNLPRERIAAVVDKMVADGTLRVLEEKP